MTKYLAVKVEGIEHWFWFLSSKVSRENGRFIGSEGWGKDGAFSSLDVDENIIIGTIESEELQYTED